MITTGHTNVDYEMVQKNAKAIFDTKNVTKNLKNKTILKFCKEVIYDFK